jgi:membrane protein DedA with SNARE-associated domain
MRLAFVGILLMVAITVLIGLAGHKTARLVDGTIVWVVIVTILIGIVGYVLDRRTARQERREQ